MRRLLILIGLSAMLSVGYGQEKEKDINKVGFKLDINSSYLVGNIADTTEFGGRTGFSAGIFYREALGGIFGGQLEIRYVQMGGVNKKYDVETELDYVRLGAQFKLYPLTSTLGANAFLGFEYGILLNAKQQDIANKDAFIDLKDLYSAGDYGIHVGAGLDFDFGLTTDLRVYLGLADITEGSPDARNLSIQYHLGWGF
jgi:hypothetical protein